MACLEKRDIPAKVQGRHYKWIERDDCAWWAAGLGTFSLQCACKGIWCSGGPYICRLNTSEATSKWWNEEIKAKTRSKCKLIETGVTGEINALAFRWCTLGAAIAGRGGKASKGFTTNSTRLATIVIAFVAPESELQSSSIRGCRRLSTYQRSIRWEGWARTEAAVERNSNQPLSKFETNFVLEPIKDTF
jgi:hypothetical protein